MTLLVSVLVCLSAAAIPLKAQQEGTGNGLQISPTRTELLQVNPGEVKTFTISVKNVTQAPVIAKATLNDFESDGTSGEPKIIVENNRERPPSSLEPFIQGLRDIELQPGEAEEVELSIDVPGNAAPGAYYGAIRFTAAPGGVDENTDRQVTLTASVASLVLVEVSGDIREQIQVRKVQAQRDGKAGSFFINPPNELAVEIKNNGNSFSKPFGRVTINKGKKEVSSYELNNKDPRGNILPGSVRIFTDKLENTNSLGRYTASISVSHGNGGQLITQSVSFWYLPVWFLALLAALVVAVGAGGFLLYKKKFGKKRKLKQPRKK